MTILVVEADDAERKELLDLCAEAVGVRDGPAALNELQMARACPSVILLDLEIALTDGVICTALHYGHALAPIPIVLMSARQDTPTQAARLGVGAYLSKPCAAEAVEAIVQCYAPRPRSQERGGVHDDPGGCPLPDPTV